MRDSWANSGVDLLLELRGSRGRSGVEDALREAVINGRLAPGVRLPSSRALAGELGLARNTVADAYSSLVSEGWLTARQGSGTEVAPATRGTPTRRRPPVLPNAPRFDLRPGAPDLSAFPRSAWQQAARRAMTTTSHLSLGYPDPRGLPELRAELARYLARVRGVRAEADQILICSGFVQALQLLATTLRRGGASTLAVEALGMVLHREIIRAAGLDITEIGVDSDGARVAELAAADGVLLTPAHQAPTGVPLAADRRTDVLRWARERSALIIEDDYDGEFRYDRRPIGALQSLAPDLVAYVGTASKSLAPGLGLAWLVVPESRLDEVIDAKRLSDGYTGVFEQLTLAEFLRGGGYDRHVRRSRLHYRRRRDHLLAELDRRRVPATVTGIAAGLHVLLGLDGLSARDEAAVVTRAARAGLALSPLGFYREVPDPDAPAGLTIGYGRPPASAYAGAVDALCDVLG